MSTVAITVEGVLRQPVGGQPIPLGRDLYYGMATRARLVLLSRGNEKRELEHWLTSEGMHEHATVIYTSVPELEHEESESRVLQVTRARNSGYAVDTVVEADPDVAAALLAAGYDVLMFCHTHYSQPSWRPDYQFRVRPWDSLAEQVAHEAYLRAEEERRKKEKT